MELVDKVKSQRMKKKKSTKMIADLNKKLLFSVIFSAIFASTSPFLMIMNKRRSA